MVRTVWKLKYPNKDRKPTIWRRHPLSKQSLLKKINDIAGYYLDEVQESNHQKTMLLHDPIHHTIKFEKHERNILDNPFLQRLKHIKQMGLAYVAYPDALHSRFAHSAGVAHLSSKILSSSFPKASGSLKKDIRIAGLLHDIGHGPLSHVSDRLIKDGFIQLDNLFSYGHTINDLIVEYRHKNFHELVGYLLVRSKGFREYMENLQKSCELQDLPDVNFISSLIIGDFLGAYTDDAERSIATKVINGDMDADKIDYILRDSAYTGLPIPIDYERLTFLFEKIEERGKKGKRFELGVSEKGARSFDLLLRSKAMLFPTVYQHHTTRGCEGMLIIAMTIALNDPAEYNGVKITTPLDFLYMNDCHLVEYLSGHPNPIVQDTIKRLGRRSHYRRAFEIQHWFFESRANRLPTSKETEIMEQLDKLYRIFIESRIDRDFRIKLKQQMLKGVNLKKKFPSLSSVSKDEICDFTIFFDLPDPPPPKAYTEPYVKTKDPITNKCVRASLIDMGFDMPSRKQTLTARVYCLPEIRNEVRSAFKMHIKKSYPMLYSAGDINLTS